MFTYGSPPIAVLRGVRAAQLVEHTRTWVAEHLEVTERASAGGVFAQARAMLMRIGGRTSVNEALEAVGDTGDTNDCSQELLGLSITLAAVMFGHGDRADAAARGAADGSRTAGRGLRSRDVHDGRSRDGRLSDRADRRAAGGPAAAHPGQP